MLSRETLLKKALEDIKNEFDLVIIDCPPSLGLLTINALGASNKLLIPIQCEYFALEGLGQLINTMNLIKGINPTLVLGGVILTMYDSRTKLSSSVVEDVRHFFKESALFQYDSKSTGARAYNSLAREFIKKFL